MTVAVDTNVLAYAEGVNGAVNKEAAIGLLQALPSNATLVPVQALGELFTVLVRKAGKTKREAASAILSWGDAFPLIDTSHDVMLAATDLTQAHQMGLWDAVILSAAADARCRLLLSEDMQEGFTWRGVTVTNPFASAKHPLLEALLEASD